MAKYLHFATQGQIGLGLCLRYGFKEHKSCVWN